MFIVNLIIFTVIGIFVIAIILILLMLLEYFLSFHNRRCPNCGNKQTYIGLRGEGTDKHYLFHCKHCDSWEKVPYKYNNNIKN